MASKTHLPTGILLACLLAASPAILHPQGRNIEFHGFLLGNFTARTTGLIPEGGDESDYLLAEERLRLDISAWSGSANASARIKSDLRHDALSDEFDVDIREAYIDYTTGPLDLRFGRHIVTWGVGDLLFINDVFPKDWESFFTGRPLEYLKSGIDGLRTRYSANPLGIEVLVIPFFDPDRLPAADRFFLYDPMASIDAREETTPEAEFGNTELALRLFRSVLGFDVSVHAYRGFWRTPSARPDDYQNPTRLTLFYPELAVYGLSAQGNGLGGVVSLEGGYYDSREDRAGDDPLVPNSQVRFLAGYQRQFGDDLNTGIQYYMEVMADHEAYRGSLPAGFPEQEKKRDTLTLRIERTFRYHTWKVGGFAFYSPADRDYLVQPRVTHQFSDELSLAVGGNIFGGERGTTFLGQFDRNDNAYLSARFDF